MISIHTTRHRYSWLGRLAFLARTSAAFLCFSVRLACCALSSCLRRSSAACASFNSQIKP